MPRRIEPTHFARAGQPKPARMATRADAAGRQRECFRNAMVARRHDDQPERNCGPRYRKTPPTQFLRPEASSLQFDRLHLCNEPSGITAQVRGNHVENGVTEAADVQDVGTLGCLCRSVGLDVDADQFR